MRALNTKSDDFYASVSQSEYDIIMLTEIWLNPNANDNELFPDQYHVFWRDSKFSLVAQTHNGRKD